MTWANVDTDDYSIEEGQHGDNLNVFEERELNGRTNGVEEREVERREQQTQQRQMVIDEGDEEYRKPISEMTPQERTAFNWFNNSSGQLDEAVRNADDKVKYDKRVHRRATNAIFYLSGDKPLTTKEDFERLKKQLCSDTKRIKFIALGAPERSEDGRIHQHGIAIYDTVVDYRKVPRLICADGSVMSIAFGQATMYSQNTEDFKRYIWYMNKNSDNVNKCFLMQDNGYLTKDGQCPPPKKRDINDDWVKCLKMDDFGAAVQAMNDWHPVTFPSKEGQFARLWNRAHYMQQIKNQIRSNNFTEWKTDSPAVRMINNWIFRAKDPKNLRPGNLFIVGPSLSGKSELINRKVVLPFNVFKLRGDLMFDSYDPTVNYDFYVFDDMNKIGNDYISVCKTLTSGAKGEWNQQNVKYSMALPKCAPIIHLMNWEKFHRFINTSQHTGAYNSWWKDNMEVVVVDDYLYPTDKHIDEQLTVDESRAKIFAYKQILYRHPNKKVPIDERGEQDLVIDDKIQEGIDDMEEFDRKHYMETDRETLDILRDVSTRAKQLMPGNN